MKTTYAQMKFVFKHNFVKVVKNGKINPPFHGIDFTCFCNSHVIDRKVSTNGVEITLENIRGYTITGIAPINHPLSKVTRGTKIKLQDKLYDAYLQELAYSYAGDLKFFESASDYAYILDSYANKLQVEYQQEIARYTTTAA